MTIGLGFSFAHFSYPVPANGLAAAVIAQAREAEDAGFDTVTLFDHLSHPPMAGRSVAPTLECYTTLSAVAMRTSVIRLAAMATANTFRNPALLAKTVTTLDVLSGGRAMLGIGAGWYEAEHHQFGFEFGTAAERSERLAEALDIIGPMLAGRASTFEGRWYRTRDADNEPRLRDDVPIVIGGAGERRTFAVAAKHAAHLDILCSPADLPRKLEALEQRCAEQGRARETLTTSTSGMVYIDEDGDAARLLQRDFLRECGIDLEVLDPSARAAITADHYVGTPDDVAEQVQEKVLKAGVDGFCATIPANAHVPGVVDLVGRTLRPLIPVLS